MQKETAIQNLGGSITAAAKAIGVSYQAVRKWPDPLPPRIADRVTAALVRLGETKVKPKARNFKAVETSSL